MINPFPNSLQHHAVNGEISLARRDVRNIYASRPTCGVVATIIWSHARGIRVNALSLLVRDLTKLVELFENDDFDEDQMSLLLGQPGISIPTASKMLSACGKKYKGKPATIIDDTIIQVIVSTGICIRLYGNQRASRQIAQPAYSLLRSLSRRCRVNLWQIRCLCRYGRSLFVGICACRCAGKRSTEIRLKTDTLCGISFKPHRVSADGYCPAPFYQ